MLNKESLIEVMRELKKCGVKELIVAHDRVEMRTYERGGTSGAEGASAPTGPRAEASAPTGPRAEASAPAEPRAEASAPTGPRAEASAPAEPRAEGELVEVRAPLPGTAFVAPGKDSNKKPLPGEGEAVDEKTVVALVEAMKMFNDVYAPVKGTVRRLHVGNESKVKVGDLIMEIETSVGGK